MSAYWRLEFRRDLKFYNTRGLLDYAVYYAMSKYLFINLMLLFTRS